MTTEALREAVDAIATLLQMDDVPTLALLPSVRQLHLVCRQILQEDEQDTSDAVKAIMDELFAPAGEEDAAS